MHIAVSLGGLCETRMVWGKALAVRQAASSHAANEDSGNSLGVPKGVKVEAPTPKAAMPGAISRTRVWRLQPFSLSQASTSGLSILPLWARTGRPGAARAFMTDSAWRTPPVMVRSPVTSTPSAWASSGISAKFSGAS